MTMMTTTTMTMMVMAMAARVTVVPLVAMEVGVMMMAAAAKEEAAVAEERGAALEAELEQGRRSAQAAGAAEYFYGSDAGRGASRQCPLSCVPGGRGMGRLNEPARAGRRGNLRGVRGCTSAPWGYGGRAAIWRAFEVCGKLWTRGRSAAEKANLHST